MSAQDTSLEAATEKPVVQNDSQEESQHDQSLERPLTNSSTAPIRDFPDGGFQAWSQVICSFFLFFNSWGIVNSFGAFQSYYTSTNLETPSTISWIGSSQAFLLLFVGVFTGPLFDAGYFYALLWTGTFLTVFGLMMTSLGTQYYQIVLAQGICVGLGSGFLFMPSITIIPQYFLKRRALAQGLGASGSSLGGILYPIIFYKLQPQIGFAWTTRVMGFIVLSTQALVLILVRTRTKPAPARQLVNFHFFREPAYLTYVAGMFVALIGTYIPFFYLNEYTLTLPGGRDSDLSFYMVSIANAGSVAGRILPNFMADYVGPLNILTPAALISGILGLCWIGIHNIPSLIVFSVLYGFFSGCMISLPPTVMANLTPRIEILGTRLGTMFLVASLGLLIGTPVAGAILGEGRNYVGLQAFGAVTVAVAGVMFGITRVLHKGTKLRIKV